MAWYKRVLSILLAIATLLGSIYLLRDSDSSSLPNSIRYALIRQEFKNFTGPKDVPFFTALLIRQFPVLMQAAEDRPAEEIRHGSEELPSTPAPAVPTPAERTYQDNGIPSQTVIPSSNAGYTVVDEVYIKNASSKTLDVSELSDGHFDAVLQKESPQVLIVHTHGSEAYAMPKGQDYVSTGTYRTSDTAFNVVRVGDEIASTLSSYGISVVHDRTLYDDPLYDGAYERSAAGIEAYLGKYPSLTYVLDIHRDAVQDASGQQYKLITKEDPHCAQISFIMGSNNDHWQENLKLAIAASAAVTELCPTAMRPITLRNSNYNQHLTSGSMLVEIGAAGNSLEEALTAGQLFARGFAAAVLENTK